MLPSFSLSFVAQKCGYRICKLSTAAHRRFPAAIQSVREAEPTRLVTNRDKRTLVL